MPPSQERESGSVQENYTGIPKIKDKDFKVAYVRSSGPGGQKTNKTSTKAFARLPIDDVGFSPEQLRTLKTKLGGHINEEGMLWADCDVHRNQKQNKAEVILRMRGWIAEALKPEIPRVPTKPTRASQERRVQEEMNERRKNAERRAGRQIGKSKGDEY